jgi:hypothetical protein
MMASRERRTASNEIFNWIWGHKTVDPVLVGKILKVFLKDQICRHRVEIYSMRLPQSC